MALKDRKKADRERQKRYRENLKSKGIKPLRVNITPEAKSAIDAECERTGETQAQVVERCATQLGDVNQAMLDIVLELSKNQVKLKAEYPDLYQPYTKVSNFFKRAARPGIFDFKN